MIKVFIRTGLHTQIGDVFFPRVGSKFHQWRWHLAQSIARVLLSLYVSGVSPAAYSIMALVPNHEISE